MRLTRSGSSELLKAEGDTTLRGATATADRIDVKTGGTLTIKSLQDIAESMSKNSQVGGSVQVAFGNAWNADGYVSAGKAEGSYQGAGQQSGLFADNGGYHVDAGHVNLIGGAIASTNAGNSELTAQTLTFSDLQNQMDYSAEAMQILSHALLGALLAEANGGSAGSGALAAGGGELAAKFLGDYYAKQNGGQLTPEQEQQVKALGQAVGALAGGIGGDGVMGAALGATIAKNAVENNYLNHAERMQYLNAMLSCAKEGKSCAEEKQLAALSDARNSALIAACKGASDSPACKAEQTKLGDAYWSLSMNESTYIKWIKDNGAELAAAALKNGNSGQIAGDFLTHTSGLDARYKLTCAEAGRCDPFTTGFLFLNGRGQESIDNALLNLVFNQGGQIAGAGTNVGGLVMAVANMNLYNRVINEVKGSIADYQRAQEIGGWCVLKERGQASGPEFLATLATVGTRQPTSLA